MDRRKYKTGSIFTFLESQIKFELSTYREYVEETSSNLTEKISEIEKRFERLRSEEEDEDYYRDVLIDDYWKYDKMHSKFTYNPMLLSLYGFFEHYLKRLCEYDHYKGFSKVTVYDFRGSNYIEKSLRYFEKVCDISLDELEEETKRIRKIQEMRNLITHNDACLYKNGSNINYNRELGAFLESEVDIDFDSKSGDFFVKKKEFVLELIDLIEDYLFYVSEKVQQRKVVAKNAKLPHDMTIWGLEKSEKLIQDVIYGLDTIDEYKKQPQNLTVNEVLEFSRKNFVGMSRNLTKILSFFSNGRWDHSDVDHIVNERSNGLEKLKDIYLSN